jgi:hypothetical protein
MGYSIHLGGYIIGTTKLENADAPMRVVFGKIEFNEPSIDYDFLKAYCKSMDIELTADYPEDKLISSRTIESQKIINKTGIEVKGVGNQIIGMDSDGFEITLEGVPYPFYEE